MKYKRNIHDYVDLLTHNSCHAIQFIVMFDDKIVMTLSTFDFRLLS